jgi:hypothetical protein
MVANGQLHAPTTLLLVLITGVGLEVVVKSYNFCSLSVDNIYVKWS